MIGWRLNYIAVHFEVIDASSDSWIHGGCVADVDAARVHSERKRSGGGADRRIVHEQDVSAQRRRGRLRANQFNVVQREAAAKRVGSAQRHCRGERHVAQLDARRNGRRKLGPRVPDAAHVHRASVERRHKHFG